MLLKKIKISVKTYKLKLVKNMNNVIVKVTNIVA